MDRTGTTAAGPWLDRAVDADTHEMVPFHLWAQEFGESVAETMAPFAASPRFTDNGVNSIVRPDIVADDVPMTSEVVWTMKGAGAPAAIDMGRRTELMDLMGVDRALMFPSFGLIGMRLAASPELAGPAFALDITAADARRIGVEVMEAANDWAARVTGETGGRRLRPVAVMLLESADRMTAQLARLIEQGIRAIWIPAASPPADTSPADPALDAFWRMAADADVAVTLHVGSDFSFAASTRWSANVPAFATPKASVEFPVGPYTGATVNFASENYLAAMVLGGVFERVPNLRFGVIEIGAGWFGPLAERLDMWAGELHKALRGVLSMRPSEYLARNVRVTPLNFEPIDRYFERYPDLADCYCFSTDYPHLEGGAAIKAQNLATLGPLGADVAEKYFVRNGEWLCP
ncbi:hypothetical protein GCM10009836_42160 [Pseudonocardia ailaonensis]|uniref:Amidohydrolase-related domain-containing protein n=1 Tax=Pseudonocardia ailaonensis TaxID=367279 RepID=A0ABN2NBM2_9PSEU